MRVELILLGLGVLAVTWLRRQSEQSRRGHEDEERGTWRSGGRGRRSHAQADETDPATGRSGSVRFSESGAADRPDQKTRDAFTGQRLRTGVRLFHCVDCKSYYHEESVDLLRRENGGRCASCSGRNIVRDTIAEQTVNATRQPDQGADS